MLSSSFAVPTRPSPTRPVGCIDDFDLHGGEFIANAIRGCPIFGFARGLSLGQYRVDLWIVFPFGLDTGGDASGESQAEHDIECA